MKLMKKFIAFCIVGLFAAIIEYSSFNLFFYLSSIFVFSKGFALFLSNIFVFTINRNITFASKNRRKREQALRYFIVYLVAFFVSVGVGSLAFNFIGEGVLNSNISAIIGTLFAIPITFFGSLLWVFPNN